MKNCLLVMVVIALIGALPVEAQIIDLTISPGADIPLGPADSTGKNIYTFGGGVTLTGDITLPFAPLFFAEGLIGIDMIGLNTSAGQSLPLTTLGAGGGIALRPLPKLGLKLSAVGGYGLGFYKGVAGGAGFVQGGAGASFFLTPSFSLGLGAFYRNCFGIYEGIGTSITGTFQLGSGSKPRVEIRDINIAPVFPVFHTYYNTHPLGSVRVKNGENGPIQGVTVSFFVKQFMDKPKPCAELGEMKWGEERTANLFGLFTDRILKVTEGTEVTAEIIVEYKYLNEDRTAAATATLPVNNRNAMTWDDDRKAASFVTYRDPGVNQFAKSVGGLAREQGAKAVKLNLREAIGIFEALSLYGINYVADPKTPYLESIKNPASIDSLQFPIQTLTYKAGDCDDLSILYCALLESIGIDTAFITVPGHIYMAFSLDVPPDEARKTFTRPEDFVFKDSHSWVPVEITMVQEGFFKAWQEGAREWRENDARGEAKFYPMDASWALYAPTGIESDASLVTPPKAELVAARLKTAIERFVNREIEGTVAALRDEAARTKNDPVVVNKLGVLYARYGLYDKAEVEFKKAASKNYVPAFANLGNLFLIGKDLDKAASWFSRASAMDPQDASVLVGLAKVSYEKENYGQVRETYQKLRALDPGLAEKYAYLVSTRKDDAGRAGLAEERDDVAWDVKN